MLWGADVSPDLISMVTEAVAAEVSAWQARPLEALYPVVSFDALRAKMRDEGMVRDKAVCLALGAGARRQRPRPPSSPRGARHPAAPQRTPAPPVSAS